MSTNRLFNVFIFAALVVIVVLTISQAVATTKVVLAASNSSNALYCFSGMDRLSLTSVYVEEARAWIPLTNHGATGVDGGLLELLSKSRSCSVVKEK